MPTPATQPVFIRRRCIRFRHTSSSCSACVDACAKKVLTLEDSNLMLASAACSSCGACVGACPVEALEINTPSDQDIQRALPQAASNGVLSISCLRTPAKNGCLRLSCLSRLDPSMLLYAAAHGIHTIEVSIGRCTGCPEHSAHSAQHLFEETREMAALSGTKLTIDQHVATGGLDASRRRLFSRLFEDRTFTAMASDPSDDQVASLRPEKIGSASINEPAQRLPVKRLRLLSSLKRLNVMAKAEKTEANQSLPPASIQKNKSIGDFFRRPSIDAERCSGCALCVAVCPTGALGMTEEHAVQAFSCRPSLCLDCNLCTEVCYQNAVSLQAINSLEQLLANPTTELFRRKLDKDIFSSTWEDKLSAMIDAPIYRT